MYDGIVQDLIDEFGRLPGIGPKSAQRIAFHILQTPVAVIGGLTYNFLPFMVEQENLYALCAPRGK